MLHGQRINPGIVHEAFRNLYLQVVEFPGFIDPENLLLSLQEAGMMHPLIERPMDTIW